MLYQLNGRCVVWTRFEAKSLRVQDGPPILIIYGVGADLSIEKIIL
jgi:hypothetical protein